MSARARLTPMVLGGEVWECIIIFTTRKSCDTPSRFEVGHGAIDECVVFVTVPGFHTQTPEHVFRRLRVPQVVHYLSLDVEGAEDLILPHLPFKNIHFTY